MGVRFPTEQQRPDLPDIQQAAAFERLNQQEPQGPDAASTGQMRVREPNTIPEPPEQNPPEPPATEELARRVGTQTPGTIIDIFA